MTRSCDDQVEKFQFGGHGVRGAIHVGLVNNMPDEAMRGTELQFARLLKEAAGSLDVQLHLFSPGGIARGEAARSRMEGFYADAETLPAAEVDALIFTGAGPHAANLIEQNYWPSLAHLIDWAQTATVSTLFSCVAAHAAVQHLSGIARIKLPRKMSGIFPAARVGEDALQAGMPSRIPVPHARHHTLSDHELARHGYRILSRLDDGVDSFTRRMPGGSQFVFLQGHPEYGAESLGREYLRDVDCFLRGESAERPLPPLNYFDRITENALAELDVESRTPEDLARYAGVVSGALPLHSWHKHTVRLFGNWLASIAAEKLRRRTQPLLRPKLRA